MMDEKTAPLESDSSSPTPSLPDRYLIQSENIKPQLRLLHDRNVTFEEYHYYAQLTREEEKDLVAPKLRIRELLFNKKSNADQNENSTQATMDAAVKNHTEANFASPETRAVISDEEWSNASRAFRTASSGAAFYLITTDILGPYGVGYAMGTLGWGPGIALYTVFGFMAGYSGYLIWRMFIGLDSYQFPCRNYGDLAFRTWGRPLRHITNFIQALGLLLLLGQVTIQFGENISEVSRFRLCYAVCPLIFAVCGFGMTQIRTLKNFGLVANLAVWLNVLTMILTMAFMAHSPPNYSIATLGSAGATVDPASITPNKDGVYPPLVHYAGLPAQNLVGSINGLLSGVLAYAGAQLFVEFMAEMRKPMGFLKAMWFAQFFIYTIYLVYGCYVYYFQGQYAFSISYLGVSVYSWQTVGNMISLVAALISAALYGNIGIKVLYNNVLMEWFNFPPLVTRRGKILYAVIVPMWWTTAFIIAAAIPAYNYFVSVMSASCLLNLTYTMPPLFSLGYQIQKAALRPELGEGFDPATGRVQRHGTMVQRYIRGFTSGGPVRVAQNVWHVIYFLASLSMSGLGMYAAVEGMISAFEIKEVTSFTCVSPLNLNAS